MKNKISEKVYVYASAWGRGGRIVSVFSATPEEVHGYNGKAAYFGEALGKHSEVTLMIAARDFTIVNETWQGEPFCIGPSVASAICDGESEDDDGEDEE